MHLFFLSYQDELISMARSSRPDLDVRLSIFTPTDLSFRQQLQIVRESRVLVAFHGAGLAHLMFMHPESSVIELTDATYWMRTHFSTLSRNFGSTFMMYVIEGIFNVNDQFHIPWNYFVDLINIHAPKS